MRLKILHIIHSLHIGGLENGVVNLINHLDSGKFSHVICCVDSSGPMQERIINKEVEIFELKKKGRDYLLPFKLIKIINRVRPDIVHTRNWATIDGVIGARLAGIRKIIHGEHGREASDPAGTNTVRKKVRRILSPWISKFVTVSSELRNWLINDVGISQSKVTQIINGVDTMKFIPIKDKGLSKKRIGLDPNTFVIGTVGRLDPVKDYITLFRAFRNILHEKKIRNARLLIVGEGPLKDDLKRIAKDFNISKEIIFIGQRRDIHLIYPCMDVYVLPSIAEGISNTILEAMACGLPVIATAVGGNPELVNDGKSGFIFTSGDHGRLTEKLSFYHHNHIILKEHGLNGRSRAEKKFPLSRMVREYEELYNSIGNEGVYHEEKDNNMEFDTLHN
jgi:sugar transferase (PEP-CTERM/EpsH1 system associated)